MTRIYDPACCIDVIEFFFNGGTIIFAFNCIIAWPTTGLKVLFITFAIDFVTLIFMQISRLQMNQIIYRKFSISELKYNWKIKFKCDDIYVECGNCCFMLTVTTFIHMLGSALQ